MEFDLRKPRSLEPSGKLGPAGRITRYPYNSSRQEAIHAGTISGQIQTATGTCRVQNGFHSHSRGRWQCIRQNEALRHSAHCPTRSRYEKNPWSLAVPVGVPLDHAILLALDH